MTDVILETFEHGEVDFAAYVIDKNTSLVLNCIGAETPSELDEYAKDLSYNVVEVRPWEHAA